MTTLWHNGEFYDDNRKLFEFADRIRLGDGIFDTLLISPDVDKNFLIHNSQRHFERFLKHAKDYGFQLDLLPDKSDIIQHIQALIDENKLDSKRYVINLLLTRGVAIRGLKIPDDPSHSLTIKISDAPEGDAPDIHAIISEKIKRNEGSPLSRIKSCNYGDNILALAEARQKGGNEAILLNNKGKVTCASTSNIFIMKDDRIFTPLLSDGVLDGVTRARIIEKYDATEKSLTETDLEQADAIFLTNSVFGVRFIKTLNKKELPGSNMPIENTAHLM